MLIDDDDVDAEGLKRSFERLDNRFELIIAKDGIDALEKLRGKDGVKVARPNMLLLDINMPRMTGIEFLRHIRTDDKLNDLIVFVLTTSSTQKDIYAAYDLNVAGYMLKSEVGDSYVRAVELLRNYADLIVFPN